MENTCLMVVFWGGLAEPFKSRMPYWVPEELLEDYINLALNLSGSAFRVELAAEPAPVQKPTESAPEPAPFREPTESAPEPAPFWEPTESAPEPAPFREPTESAPEPAPFREPTESTPEPVPGAHSVPGAHAVRSVPGAHAVRSRAHSVPGAHAVRSRAHSVPGAHAVRSVPGAHTVCSRARSGQGAHRLRSRARSSPGAHAVHSSPGPRSGLGTHRARSRASPTLAPLCAHCSRPSSTPRAWPTSLLDIFLFSVCGASGIRSLKGGGYVTVLLVCPGWPPDVSVCWAHGLLFVGAMCSHVDCLSPPILLLNHCFSGSSCVSLVTLVCLPI